jgi:hypothetical protein
MAITGLGKLIFIDETLNVVYFGRLNTFQLTKETATQDINAYPFEPGPLQIVDTKVQSETYTLTVGTASFDRADFQFIFEEVEGTADDVVLPDPVVAVVPATGPYTITVTGLLADEAVQVQALTPIGSEQFLTQIASSGTVATGQFEVTADTVTVFSDLAGQTILINRNRTFATATGIGLTDVAAGKFGKMAFSGVIAGTRFPTPPRLYLPQVSSLGSIDINITDTTQVNKQFRAEVPAGSRLPYKIAFETTLV